MPALSLGSVVYSSFYRCLAGSAPKVTALAHLIIGKCVLFLRLGIFKGQARALGSVAKIRLYLVLRHRLARHATAPRVTLGAFLGPANHSAEVKCFLAVGHADRATCDEWALCPVGEHRGKDAVICSTGIVENCDGVEGVGVGHDESVSHVGAP